MGARSLETTLPRNAIANNIEEKKMAKKMTLTAALLGAVGAALLALMMVVLAQPRAASGAETLVVDKTVMVPESAADVNTGVDVHKGDRLVVSASGTIWAGVLPGPPFEYRNGPQGSDKKDCDPKFPLPCSYPYALLGKLNGSYFYIGNGIDQIQNSGDSRLYLRINDDRPGNGNGAFTANIQVYRDVQTPSPTPTPTPTPQPNNAPPTIDPVKPAPGSKIHNRSPLIAAKVSDAETDLAQSNIMLFVDGKPITNFSYDAATDRLSYRSGKLAYGRHTVKVEATDASAHKGENTWTFKVVKR